MTRLVHLHPSKSWFCILASAALSACASHEASHFIGKNPAQAFPADFLVGQRTMQFDESKPGVDWGMSLVWQGDHYLLSADQNTTPNQATQTWQIVAIQDIPLLKKGQMIAMGSCRREGKPDSRVVAILDYAADQQWFDRIEADWAYDYQQDTFVSYPTAVIQCFNTRYGLSLDKPKSLPATSAVPAPVTFTRPRP
jgi:hypothetical protein